MLEYDMGGAMFFYRTDIPPKRFFGITVNKNVTTMQFIEYSESEYWEAFQKEIIK